MCVFLSSLKCSIRWEISGEDDADEEELVPRGLLASSLPVGQSYNFILQLLLFCSDPNFWLLSILSTVYCKS